MEQTERLEYLRSQIRAECISMGELAELQGLADSIDRGDVELLEWAGVPEFPRGDPVTALTYGTVRDAVADAPTPGAGLFYTRTGYGPKVPTRYRVRLSTDSPTGRLRRVYAMSYGNAASLYVIVKGTDVFLDEADLRDVLDRSAA